ncbi:MAG: hypothetical protein A2078_05980 [Nitrospirae bacterium GWC2_57_9]|nr:MAG: hypothetical protein A2078_05980 [Nitrospirae bacterium GWC2_57_9]
MENKVIIKVLSVWLAFTTLTFSLPGQGWAMFIPSSASDSRTADLATIQRTLESSIVKQRLMDIGLSSEEAMERMNGLSDEQIHQFASRLDSLQAGAGIVDALVIVLLGVVIVVGVLELTGHSIIIR